MEGGPGNDTSAVASAPVASSQSQDSVIASYKELIKEQVGIDNQLASSLLTTCSRLVIIKSEQAM